MWFENCTVFNISTSKPKVCKGNTAALLPWNANRQITFWSLLCAWSIVLHYRSIQKPVFSLSNDNLTRFQLGLSGAYHMGLYTEYPKWLVVFIPVLHGGSSASKGGWEWRRRGDRWPGIVCINIFGSRADLFQPYFTATTLRGNHAAGYHEQRYTKSAPKCKNTATTR